MAEIPTRRWAGLRALVGVAAVMVVIAGLRAAQVIIVPVLIAGFIAILSAPAVVWLHRRRVPNAIAVALVVLVVMVALAVLVALLATNVDDFTQALPRYQARLERLVAAVLAWLAAHGAAEEGTRLVSFFRLGPALQVMGTMLKAVLAALSNLLLVILTLVFILLEAAGFPFKLRVALGDPEADIAGFTVVISQIQNYLRIKTAVSLATGTILGGWVALLGVDFPLLWGLVAFLFNYVPSIGSIVAAVPPVLLALVLFGPGRALLVALGYMVVNTSLGNLLEPQLMGRRLGLSPLVIFLSLLFWGWIWGPIGMLLAVPLTMMGRILLENTRDFAWVATLLESPRAVAWSPPTRPRP